MSTLKKHLEVSDINFLKGIAIVAMIFHHMYYCASGWQPYDGFFNFLGNVGKVCVSLFLFCSGYGLSCQYSKLDKTLDKVCFSVKRFVKFYSNYWVIFLIFVPITVFLFDRPLSAAYGDNVNLIKRVVLDLLGGQGLCSYNITWWFNQLILLLYLLFPLLFYIANKTPLLAVIISLGLFFFSNSIPYNLADIYVFQVPFLLGIFWVKYEEAIHNLLSKIPSYVLQISLSMFLLLALIIRTNDIIPYITGSRSDGLLTAAIVLFYMGFSMPNCKLHKWIVFLGIHSANIYLFHTFINGYWHPQWLHTSPIMRSGLNFFVLLGICLAISVIIEFMKNKLGYNKLVNKVTSKLSVHR